jgi:hypothetical protein
MPRAFPPVDKSHRTPELLRATRDGKLHVLYTGGELLSGQAGGVTRTAAYADRTTGCRSSRRRSTSERQID